jgi:hypothetical protein
MDDNIKMDPTGMGYEDVTWNCLSILRGVLFGIVSNTVHGFDSVDVVFVQVINDEFLFLNIGI